MEPFWNHLEESCPEANLGVVHNLLFLWRNLAEG